MAYHISALINAFVETSITQNLLSKGDKYYCTNRLMSLVKIDELTEGEQAPISNLLAIMDAITDYAVEHNLIEDISYQREQFEAAIMDLITPTPSQLNVLFWQKYRQNPEAATNYFYELSKANDYIKTRNIAKNIEFKAPYKQYGELDITINLSKPEKDPKEIALAKTAKQSNYPLCLLCMENEGYQGRSNHPARQQHRLIRLSLNEQNYGMQYSPYVYYNEHSIFLSEQHIPMKIDRKAIDNLLAIVDVLPHYFAGSNADLPIVGGSILAHDHYQGGRYIFPMEKANEFQSVSLKGFDDIEVTLVEWPMSVIRLKGDDRHRVAQAGEALFHAWQQYSDPEVDILAYTDTTPHNTITPVARRRGKQFELDVVLRNNRTTGEYPDGIFHPHKDVQHIKKENIGLIEVMGLAILPPRLVDELEVVKSFLLNKVALDEVAEYHQTWALFLKKHYPTVSEDSVQPIIEQEIANKFGRVLEDAGVYKQTEEGRAAFNRFIHAFNN